MEPPKKGKGKAKASGGGGAGGGGSSSKPKASGRSGEASTSKQGSCQRSAPSSASMAPPTPPPDVPATSSTQQSQLSKKEKEQQRKERQRRAKIDLAREMMDVALTVIAELGVRCVQESNMLLCRVRCLRWSHCVLTSRARVPLCSESTMRTMQEALQEAERYASRCEALAARMEEGRAVLEQARAEQAERARAAAEAEAAAAAVAAAVEAEAAAERQRIEQQAAELAMRMQQMQAQMQSDAMRLQQMHTQLGVAPPAAPQVEQEALCVVCMDERKQHVMVPCMHMCVCEACAQRPLDAQTPHCPVCRTPVNHSTRVFI